MKLIKLTTTNHQDVINQTLATLNSGGLVVFPSDTVYGLLADSSQPSAVSRLLSFKERPLGKAISVFVSDKEMAEKYVVLNQNALNVIKNLLPGPFTVVAKYNGNRFFVESHSCQFSLKSTVLSKPKNQKPLIKQAAETKDHLDLRLLAENGTLGFRIPDYPPVTDLVKKFGKPLTATSANLSSQPPFYSAQKLISALSEKKKKMIDLVIDGGNLPRHKPSTVIDTTSGELKTLRFGDLFPISANTIISKSEKETRGLGRFLATKFIKKCSSKPIIFLLQGELGTGKTIFAKGIGKALKIKQEVVSPTYTFCYEYSSPLSFVNKSSLTQIDFENSNQKKSEYQLNSIKLIHYDLYRIENENDLQELKFMENFVCGNIYVIEWPERIPQSTISALKKSAEIVFVTLKHLAENDKNQREISWTMS